MGQAKLLLPLEGRLVVRHVAERLLAAGLERIIVVAGTEHGAIEAALAGLPVEVVVNLHPEAGQAGSIRVGIGALPPGTQAALIALGDQPFLAGEIIPALLAARDRTGKAIVAPRYRDGRGNPVLFSRELFGELLDISGDQGARSVVERDAGRVTLVDFDLPMPQDLDTPEDYDRLRAPPYPV